MTDPEKYILPFFIPHLGCPHRCIFCDQNLVSGESSYPHSEEITEAVEHWEGETLPEIAFYGGSFTGLSETRQGYFLRPACKALKENKIRGIRVSTRPDYINEKVLQLLRFYGVTTVELGVQSLDKEVLRLSNRGHSPADVFHAIELLKEQGFKVGVQLMPGLPGDTREKSIEGSIVLSRMRPDMARIYPTLVLKNTLLHKLFLNREYNPLSLQEAVEVCRDMLAVFRFHGVNVIRIGLQPTKEIAAGVQVAAGPFHPAFGELVESALTLEQIVMAVEALFRQGCVSRINLFVSRRDCSVAAGHHRSNIHFLKERYSLEEIRIFGREEMSRGIVGISGAGIAQPELVINAAQFLRPYVERFCSFGNFMGGKQWR